MQSAADYLIRTESAMRLLFSGVDSYINLLSKATFVSGELYGPRHDEEFAAWQLKYAERLETEQAAEREFIAERFALDTLCGSILQVAEKALEVYGSNKKIPPGLPTTVKTHHAKFCVGRTIRKIPLGLVVYAARNQHTHYNDETLREPNASIFQLLATEHGYVGEKQITDPTFDMDNQRLLSLASNVTALIDWRSYDQYEEDMYDMILGPKFSLSLSVKPT